MYMYQQAKAKGWNGVPIHINLYMPGCVMYMYRQTKAKGVHFLTTYIRQFCAHDGCNRFTGRVRHVEKLP